jgi:ribonuclease HI
MASYVLTCRKNPNKQTIYIVYPGGKTEARSCLTGKHSTNYRAEVDAIMQAFTLIEKSQEDCSNV